jgi:hypothetical protein
MGKRREKKEKNREREEERNAACATMGGRCWPFGVM